MRDRLAESAEDAAREIAERWVIAFDAALARGNARAWAELFVPDSHWRNLFGLSWLCLLAGASTARSIVLQIDAIEEWAAGEAH
jgi:hypothetical protein